MRTLVVAALLALPLRAVAEPSCAEQKKALSAWLALAAADRDRGAVIAPSVSGLASVAPRKTDWSDIAMTLIVEKGGVRDGAGPLVPVTDVRAIIARNRNLDYARQNPKAAYRGIQVAAHADAPAASVRAAVVAAMASGERTWLLFGAADKRITQPPDSAVTRELAALDPGDIAGFIAILQRELGSCPAFMNMMRGMGGKTFAARLDSLIGEPVGALEECQCKPPGATVASLLWRLAFRDLGAIVAVKGKVDGLPWGKGTWGEAAPAVVQALR